MPREISNLLFDMKTACELIETFTRGKTSAQYKGDNLLRSGVSWQFAIIGEALNQAMKIEPALSERITDADRIIAFRNLLIHGYAGVDDDVVWDIIQKYLPALHREVNEILEEIGQP